MWRKVLSHSGKDIFDKFKAIKPEKLRNGLKLL